MASRAGNRQGKREPSGESPAALEVPPAAAAVLDLVERIPAGLVMTYGDIAEYLSGLPGPDGAELRLGPRQVGSVMSRWGGTVPWWRVLRADGSPPQGHEPAALARYRGEGTAMRPGGGRVDLRRARWDGEHRPG